jgi:hypothetical protein
LGKSTQQSPSASPTSNVSDFDVSCYLYLFSLGLVGAWRGADRSGVIGGSATGGSATGRSVTGLSATGRSEILVRQSAG